MKLFKNYMLLLLSITTLSFSCSDDDMNEPKQTRTIVETAQSTDILSSLVAALVKADENVDSDLVGTLNANGAFTVLAPTNDAFQALLDGLDNYSSLEDFSTPEDRAILAQILQYHVIAGAAVKSADLSNGQVVTTVQGEDLTVVINGNGVFFANATDMNAQVISADIEASNGIVHVIDKVLVPQVILDAINLGTLVDIVVGTEPLSILEAAVIKAGLAETLNGSGPFTVFAPTNDAFVALLTALGDDYNSLDDFDTEGEIDLLRNILLYHVIPSQVLAANLAEGSVSTALTDNSIEIIAESGSFVIGDASDVNTNITATDIMASNGVAHTIDKVLLPQEAIDFVNELNAMNIVETAQATSALSTLVAALVQADAGLVDLLQTDGPFTVFAPTNQAFSDLLDALGPEYNSLEDFDTPEEKALLTGILKYHVVAGTAAMSTDFSNDQMITTAQGQDVTVVLSGGVFIKDANGDNSEVVIADVSASNGVVHVIDRVLLPLN